MGYVRKCKPVKQGIPKKTMKNCLKKNSGFTILEVVAVLVILGIISALAVSTISINIDDVKRDEELNVLKAHLRYAQARAMNSDSKWGIKFGTVIIEGESVKGYWLFNESDENTKIRLPGEEKKVEAEDKFVTISNLSIISIIDFVIFNTLGSPVVLDDDENWVSIGIIINTSGGDITITANTGFIS